MGAGGRGRMNQVGGICTKAGPRDKFVGILGLFGENSSNFSNDQLLYPFRVGSSALFNFSQEDTICFKSFRN